MATTATPLSALHGDSWESPQWAVAIGGAGPDLSLWTVRAQARQESDDPVALFDWALLPGRIVIGSASVHLSSGSQITLPTIQLQLRPGDWEGKPTRWSGYLEVELSSDATTAPIERRTVVRRRRFSVAPDIVR